MDDLEPSRRHGEDSTTAAEGSAQFPVMLSEEHQRALEEHYQRHFGGPPYMVLHEISAAKVHVDVLAFPATNDRPWITLATTGMSAMPMPAPAEMECFAREELILYLPADWDFGNLLGPVPVNLLRRVAHFPSEVPDTWLSNGHTLDMGEHPLVPGSLLTDLYFRRACEQQEFHHLDLPGSVHTHFLWAVPVTEPECYVIRTDGPGELEQRLDKAGYLTLDVDRPSLVGNESRSQRRARARAQKKRARLPRTVMLEQIQCEVHRRVHEREK